MIFRKTLTILGPGDPVPDHGDSVLLIDDQTYSKASMDSLAEGIVCGASIVADESGYRLNDSARDALRSIDSVRGHVLFFATDDTHVRTFLRIAPHCDRSTFVVHWSLDLGARAALEKEGVSYVVHGRGMDCLREADIALIGNDNGKEERLFIHHCRRNGVGVVCLQEAVNMDFEGPVMRWGDRNFIGGTHALGYHARKLSVLTGNPRYDDIRREDLREAPYVLINCNFTFGVASGWARAWLDQAIEAARLAGADYRITVHPRDRTDLSGVEHVMDSGAFLVRDQIAGSYVLVSRDSSLPYEALLANRHVVYFNPFRERERCLNEDETGLISKCDTVERLSEILTSLVSKPLPLGSDTGMSGMFQHYFTGIDGSNYLRVVRGLQIFLDHDYFGEGDAQVDSYGVAWSRVWVQNVFRAQLRKVGWLRSMWQFFKYGIFGHEKG
ncbi:hypothetical protein JYT90_00030 [bacterium AH-315-P07]|nr:hypothetical protein [bacterium AH-315-P07]